MIGAGAGLIWIWSCDAADITILLSLHLLPDQETTTSDFLLYTPVLYVHFTMRRVMLTTKTS